MKEAPLQVPIRRPSGRLSIVVLLGFLWFCSAFLGGYLLGEADASTGSRRLGDLALKVDALLGRQPPTNLMASAAGLSAEQQARFKVFWEAWGLVEKEFFDRPAIDSQKMTYGAVKGMIDSLGDPNSAFSSPREKEMTDASLRGSFDGVGVQVDQRDGQLRVIAPLEGSPAERAGMRAGDVIVQ